MYMERAVDMLYQAGKRHTTIYSDFYDPVKTNEIITYARNESPDIYVRAFGGFKDAERKQIVFAGPYEPEIDDIDFPMSVVEISYDARFSKGLRHRDFLGAVLGLGLDRDKVGDIIVFDDKANLYIDTSIASFVAMQITQVGRATVKAREITVEEAEKPVFEYTERQVSLASKRIDAVISEGLSMSRGNATKLVRGKKVFVNWELVENKGKTVETGDMITVRGFGRVEIVEVVGKSRKGRLLTRLFIYK